MLANTPSYIDGLYIPAAAADAPRLAARLVGSGLLGYLVQAQLELGVEQGALQVYPAAACNARLFACGRHLPCQWLHMRLAVTTCCPKSLLCRCGASMKTYAEWQPHWQAQPAQPAQL